MTQGKNKNIDCISEKILLSEYYANKHDAYSSMIDVFESRCDKDGMTQETLAHMLGVNKGVISRRINGSANITLKTLSNMATALRCRLRITFQPNEEVIRRNYHSEYEGINSKFPTSKFPTTAANALWSTIN